MSAVASPTPRVHVLPAPVDDAQLPAAVVGGMSFLDRARMREDAAAIMERDAARLAKGDSRRATWRRMAKQNRDRAMMLRRAATMLEGPR